jgi:PAS domain S-box-containing protein
VAAGGRAGLLSSIGNKMLAVLVAVAVLPAVAVSLYALRTASDALADQALTLMAERCATDARRTESLLDSIRIDLGNSVQENGDLALLMMKLMPLPADRNEGTRATTADDWNAIQTGMARVDQRSQSDIFGRYPSCASVWVTSLGFASSQPTTILQLDRAGDSIRTQRGLERGKDEILRPLPLQTDALSQTILRAFVNARSEHSERDVLRWTVVDRDRPGEAVEVFAARIRVTDKRYPEDVGWVFEVHSWRAILDDLRSGPASAEGAVTSLYDVKPWKLEPLATSRAGAWAEIPEELDLRRHASGGAASAALFERGTIDALAFAPFTPRREDVSARYVLAIQRPATELTNNLRRFRFVFTSILAAALLLAALVGTLLARRLTRPLRVLRDGAMQIGRGDLSQTLDVRTGDEAEELAREFNAMAAQLKSLYQGMETTIAERTEQLQRALDDLRRAHASLGESERRYSDIVENASDLIQVTDAKGRIVSANRRETALLGIAADAIQGRDFFEFVAADARDVTRRAFDHVLAGHALQAFESALAIGANRLPVEISATPVLDGGAPVGVRAILRDVADRKVMEARLIKAERLSSVGALAAGVAHEINNPLGIINLFAQRALEKAKKGEIDVEKMEKIVEQTRRVAAITRNLLDFARAAPTRYAPVDLAEVVRNTCSLVADRARNSEIAIQEEVAADLPRVNGNGQQISQVLLNLLLNAIQAIDHKGTITLRVVATPTSRLPTAGRAVLVSVEDTGPGIPPEALPKMFEPFFTTKAPGEGTGLGLSVSWGILKEHHGAIFAGNRPEGGARFEFELPVEGETSQPAKSQAGRLERVEE